MEIEVLKDFGCNKCGATFVNRIELNSHKYFCKIVKVEKTEIKTLEVRCVNYLSDAKAEGEKTKIRKLCEPKIVNDNMRVHRKVRRSSANSPFQWDGQERVNFTITITDVDKYDYSDTDFYFKALARTNEGRKKLASEMRLVCERYERWFNKYNII